MKTIVITFLFFFVVNVKGDYTKTTIELDQELTESSITINGKSYIIDANALLSADGLIITINAVDNEDISFVIESKININPFTGKFTIPDKFTGWFLDAKNSANYIMSSGTLTISQISSGVIIGCLKMNGANLYDSTQTVNLIGNFKGILVEFNK